MKAIFRLRNLFTIAAIFAFFFNFWIDYSVFKKNQISDATGEEFRASYEAQLHSLTKDQITKVKEIITRDRKSDKEVESAFHTALLYDSSLIVLLVFLLLSQNRLRKKVQKKMTTSIENLRKAQTELELELLNRQISLKTTIHDLKNPLGSIRGFAELISDEGKGFPSIQEFSEVIRRISVNSLQLVDSLLKPQVNGGFQTVSLDHILRNVCIQNEILAHEKKQNLILNLSFKNAFVFGNAIQLEELLTNLISNAIKYSPQAADISIRAIDEGPIYSIEVEDAGPGFSEKDKEMAFQYGKTLSACPTSNESSHGYGLFIAKQIAESHNAKLQIQSAKTGQGACIRFEILKFNQPELESPSFI